MRREWIYGASYSKSSIFLKFIFSLAFKGHDPSYSWQSMWGVKALLLEGLKWRVGNGLNINVWDYAWLSGEGSSLIPTPAAESNRNMRVAELIDFENGCWNKEMVCEVFDDADSARVLDIPLSSSFPRDK